MTSYEAILALVGIVSLSVVACGPEVPYDPELPADCSLWDVEVDLFHVRCVDSLCHRAVDRPASGLDLESPGAGERIVNAPSNECRREVLVEPDDPTGGVFVEKLSVDPPCGLRMPLGRRKLTAAEIECVRLWTVAAANPESE